MSLIKKIGLVCALVFTMQQSLLALYVPIPTVSTPTPGQWCTDWVTAKAYAEASGIPVVALWGSAGCSICNGYNSDMNADAAFNTWRNNSPYIYIYVKDTQDWFYSWMWGVLPGADKTLTSYPFLMFYWKKDGKVIVETRYDGRTAGTDAIGSPRPARTRAVAEQLFADYSSAPLPTDAWDTNDDTRTGTTNVVALTGTATAQGAHFLNMTDTNDWMKLTGSLVGMTNYVSFASVTTNGPVTGLKAEFFIGESTTPVGLLTNLQGTFSYQATTTAPLVVKVSRLANTNAVVKYSVNYRRDIPVVGSIGYSHVKYGALPQTVYTTAEETVYEGQTVTVWLSRTLGKDLAISAMLSWSTNFPALGPISWGHGILGEQSLTFTIPEEAGYQAAAKSLKLTIASNAPAATVAGKTILSLKIYDKDFASASLSNLVTSGEPVLGQWYGYKTPVSGPEGVFAEYTNLAARLNIPLIVYWGNEGCPICNAFVATNNTPLVQGWIANQKVLFLALKGQVSEDGYVGYNWIRSHLADPGSSYPWVGFYWKKPSGELVQRAASYANTTGPQFIAGMTAWLSGYDNNGALYTTMGGQFACGNIPTARLEAEPATETVEVPFVRTKGLLTPGTNHLVVTYPDSAVVTNTFLWAPGDTHKTSLLAGVNGHYALNQQVQLLLLDNELKPVETNAITYVATVPNGACNPFFDDEPAVGEWTMSLAKATNATAQTFSNAYTLVVFSGALWCPWCVGMEETVFSTGAFKTFTQNNNIRLVMFDNPRRDGTPPTLLRHAVDSSRTKFSGSAYLSRNGITIADAEEKLSANQNQQYNEGWLFPGATRIGYPTVLLLRKDGTVACRVGLASNGTTVTNATTGVKSYPYDLAPALLRLGEALTLASDAKEENNGHRDWTEETLSKDATDSSPLSASDKNDVYLLTDIGAGIRQMIQITGPQAAMVTLSIQNAAGATLVGPITNNLLTGFTLTNMTPVAGSYLVVAATGTEFAGTSLNSTIRDYTITSSYVLTPSEAEASQMVNAATQLQVDIQSGVVYRFGGTYQCNPVDFEDLGNNLWRARRTGIATLTFVGVVGEAPFTWRIWNPGVVGFTYTTTNITETAGSCTLTVERTAGTSGAVDVLVSLNEDGTTAEAYRHAFPADGINLHWADGQVGTTSVTFTVNNDIVFDGSQVLQLGLAVTNAIPKAGIAEGKGTLSITILENDQPVVGQLQFVPAPDQYFAKPMTIVAVEGTEIPLAIERITGASTAVSATLTTTAGTLSTNTINWVNKDLVPTKQVTLTVPAMAVTKTFTVTFVPTGITAVYGKSRLTILVVAAKPAFATTMAAFNLTTYVSLQETIKLETQGSGRITLSKLSGTVPYGVRIAYNVANQEMVVSGTPSSVGKYSAVYQVSELVGMTTVKGGTIRLNMDVRSLATMNPAAVAKSYIFANYAVVDPTPNKVTGLLNLTIGTTGRLTAKYVHAVGYGVSFSATGWTAIEEDGTLVSVMQATGYVLTVRLNVAGEVDALLTETATDKDLLINLVPAPWSTLTPATPYMGYYTVALSSNTEEGAQAIGDLDHMPTGHSYMTLSMNTYSVARGLMTYAGKLANGVSFSGSGVLLPYSGAQPSVTPHEYAQLGFFKKTGKEVISGQVAIQANAKDTYKDYPRIVYGGDVAEIADVWWTHTELVPELSYQWKYGVYGGYYSSADDLAAFYATYAESYPDLPMALVFPSDTIAESTQYGAVMLYPSLYPLTVLPNTVSLTAPVTDGTSTTFTLRKATGIFTGSFRMNFAAKTGVSCRYQGVLLPGWTAGCGDCGEVAPIVEMPFGLGASLFTDQTMIGGVLRYQIRGGPVELFPATVR